MIGSSGSAPHSSNHRQPISYARRLRRLKTMRTRSNAQHGRGKEGNAKDKMQKAKSRKPNKPHIEIAYRKVRSMIESAALPVASDHWPLTTDDVSCLQRYVLEISRGRRSRASGSL